MSVPKLRFKEFSGDFEKNKLVEYTKWSSGGTPSKDNDEYWNGDIPLISGASMHTQKFFESDVNITELGLKKGSKLAPKDSILILVRGSMLFNKIPMGLTLKDVAFNQDVKCIQPTQSLNSSFLFQWFLAKENIIQNKVTSTGIGAGKLDTADLQNLEIVVPKLEEQTKIASFLSAVDEKISQLTQKHELLSQYKQGMMQKLFSQQIRFKADDGSEFGEWEEKKLGEISTTFSGGTPKSTNKKFYQGTIPFIKSGEISQKHTEQFINELALKESSAKLVKKGDLLYALYGATSGQVAISQIDGAINQAVLCIRSNLNTIYLLNFFLWKKDSILSTYLQGGQGNLSAAILKEIFVPVPCLEEQTKIANFLSAIDQKIEVVAQQIEQAKQWKKGLLQQMFI